MESHVRGDPSLRDVAEDYVQRYVGEFDFVLDCRERLRSGRSLTTSQIRALLNCMRADPNVLQLPVPAPNRTSDDESVAQVIRLPVSYQRETSSPNRQRYVDLRTRWHREFGISQHKAARVVHRIDQRSIIRYYGRATQLSYDERFDVMLRWWCGSSVPRVPNARRQLNVELLDAIDADALVSGNSCWSYCKGCTRLWEYRTSSEVIV